MAPVQAHPIFGGGNKGRKVSLVQFGARMFNFGEDNPSGSGRSRLREVDPDLHKMEGMNDEEKHQFVMRRSQEQRYNRHRELIKTYDLRGYEEQWVNV